MEIDEGLARLEPPTCNDKLIWDVWASAYHFPALTAADELGLFVLLGESPLTADAVSSRLSINLRGAEILLNLLSSLGFLEHHDGKYCLAEVSRNYLLPDSVYYWGHMLKLYLDPPIGHKAVLEALTRDRRHDRERSTKEWASGELETARAKSLTAGMHSHSLPAATGVAQHGDFRGVKKLLDLGGGSGSLCIALAHKYPDMKFTVLELPAVSTFTRAYVARAGLGDRIDIVSADMFRDPWPDGHDAILLSNVLHDWDEARCRWLCRRSYEILPPNGALFVHTMLLADTRDRPLTTVAFAMNMLVRTEGKQFSGPELINLLAGSGFTDPAITPTYGYYSLVRAGKGLRPEPPKPPVSS